VAQALRGWLNDPDLAQVRDLDAVAKLPAGEGADWHRFWAHVAALLKTAEGP
jgi:hypothetical protein